MHSLLHSLLLLIHFDSVKSLLLSCDASSYGLGPVLAHSEKPIAFISQTLSPAEKIFSAGEGSISNCFCSVVVTLTLIWQPIHIVFWPSAIETSQQVSSDSSHGILQDTTMGFNIVSISVHHIQHRPGTKMPNADALSQFPVSEET